MFGCDPIVSIITLLESQIKFLGTYGNTLSSDVLNNIGELVAQNFAKAWKRHDSPCPVPPNKLKQDTWC